MRRSILAATLILSLPAAALAQATAPNPKVQPTTVPSGAILSYDVIGLKLTNSKNESVGEIKDLVMDNGKLEGYIISVGGFLGMGEHYIDVTPSSIGISYDSGKKEWKGVINATKDELKAVPEFKYEGKFKH
jgi:PRC-barrel domain